MATITPEESNDNYIYSIFQVCVVLMFHRTTVQYSPVLHVVIHMRSSNHERQLAMVEVSNSTCSPGVSLHEWMDEDSKESLNDEERINKTKTR